MRVHIGNLLRIGDTLYGSSGDFGPAPLTALDARSGKVLWQDRSFPKATFLYADGKLIVVDEDGNLSLATVSPAGALDGTGWSPAGRWAAQAPIRVAHSSGSIKLRKRLIILKTTIDGVPGARIAQLVTKYGHPGECATPYTHEGIHPTAPAETLRSVRGGGPPAGY